MRRLLNQHLLLILIHRRHAHRARHHDVSPVARIANLEDSLARDEVFDIDLRGEDGKLLIIEQLEQRDVLQLFRIARHNGYLTFGTFFKVRPKISRPALHKPSFSRGSPPLRQHTHSKYVVLHEPKPERPL